MSSYTETSTRTQDSDCGDMGDCVAGIQGHRARRADCSKLLSPFELQFLHL